MRRQLAVAGLLMCLPVVVAWAGDAQAGRIKAEAGRCFECHGSEGQGDGQAHARFAKLAGQRASYLVQQLKNYRSGARKHDVMRLNTQHLDDVDLHDIATYFATRAPMLGGAVIGMQGDPSAGRALFSQACVSCHGEGGRGGVPDAPLLGGQDARYLEQQLLDWRSAWRTHAAMNQAAKLLTDVEIRALVAYLSSSLP